MPARRRAQDPATVSSRPLWLALLLVAALALLVGWRYQPPEPLPADAPATRFSAGRALPLLVALLGPEQAPHPLGSAAHEALRGRLAEALRGLGLDPQEQAGLACERGSECGSVTNLLARIPGTSGDGSALLLAAHYDSVPAGPGAGDDGSGVAAILEIVRALQAGPPLAHDLILLFSDGEEAGLLGARVFAGRHPWAKDVRAAVNLEARGTRGPSFMFETGSRNAALMRDYGAQVARPITNSIYFTAYRRLPNDTDFSVFRAQGWQGYNFALIGHVADYHTPNDQPARLSADSLQHHGDNALAVVRALGNAPWPEGADDEAVYADLLGWGLLQWPASAAVPLAAGLAGALLLLTLAALWRGRPRAGELLWALLAALAVPPLAAGLAAGSVALLRGLDALPPAEAGYDWTAQPLPLLAAIASAALLVVLAAGRAAALRASGAAAWLAQALWLAALLPLLAATLPGLGFATVLPAAGLLLGAGWARWRSGGMDGGDGIGIGGRATLPALALSVLGWLPTLLFLYPLLGLDVLPALAALLGWMLLPMLPLATDAGRAARGPLALALLALLAALALAALQPASDAQSPLRLNLDYRLDADSGRAEWIARPDSQRLPAALAAAVPFQRRNAAPPWLRIPHYAANAPRLALAMPEAEVLDARADGEGIRYRLALRSPAGSPALALCFPAALRPVALRLARADEAQAGFAGNGSAAARVADGADEGIEVGEPPVRTGEARCLSLHAPPPQGYRLAFTLPAAGAELQVVDLAYGLPEAAARLLAARGAEAVPSREGDCTRVLRRLRLPAPP